MITTVVFDYGGVISSPLFVGLGDFEEAEGYPRGSLLRLMFGEDEYIRLAPQLAPQVAPRAGTGRGSAPEPTVGLAAESAAALTAELVEELADAISADPDAAESAGEAVDAPAWHRLERGEITFGEYFEHICARAPAVLGRPLDLEAYARFWSSSAPGVHWMVVHRIRELRDRGLRLGLLTNNVKEFGDHWRASFPVEELFEVIVDSSHVGMRKPEFRIYELTCELMGIEPREAVFVDDNADNIAAARTLGMEAVHFGFDPWASLAELDALLARH